MFDFCISGAFLGPWCYLVLLLAACRDRSSLSCSNICATHPAPSPPDFKNHIGLFMSALSSPCPAVTPSAVTLQPVPNGDTYSLICMIEDLSSTISSVTWRKNEEEVTQGKISTARGSDSLISVLKVDKTEWESKSVFSCEVPHPGGKTVRRVKPANCS
uniref:Ig-like domain-containing protein n=1 Tax=Myripristis murdjan TaxID=586833 RepID=A0A667WUM7_9TELE